MMTWFKLGLDWCLNWGGLVFIQGHGHCNLVNLGSGIINWLAAAATSEWRTS